VPVVELVEGDSELLLQLQKLNLRVLHPFFLNSQLLDGVVEVDVGLGDIDFLALVECLQLPDLLHQELVLLLEEVVAVDEVLVVQLQKVDVESYLVRLEDVFVLGLQLPAQEVVLLDDLFAELEEGVAVVFEQFEFLLEEVYFVLVGHEEGLDVVEFLEVGLGVDEVGVLIGLGLAHGDACPLADVGELVRQLSI